MTIHGCLSDPGEGRQQAGWSNFGRLVLSCIDADFCVQIRIFQHFSRSTRFIHLRTASTLKICRFLQFSVKFRLIFQIFANVAEIAAKNVIFRWNFRRILPEFHRISAILIKQTILFSFQMNFEKNAATFAENLLFLAGRQSAKVPPSPWSRWN